MSQVPLVTVCTVEAHNKMDPRSSTTYPVFRSSWADSIWYILANAGEVEVTNRPKQWKPNLKFPAHSHLAVTVEGLCPATSTFRNVSSSVTPPTQEIASF